jgi:hypothetical protein
VPIEEEEEEEQEEELRQIITFSEFGLETVK